MKQMKKLICLLIVVCIAAFTIPMISAAGDTELVYDLPSQYEVVIPESINVNNDYSFMATKMNIRANEQVDVYAPNYTDIILTNESGDTMTVDLNSSYGGTVAQFNKGDLSSRLPMTANAIYTDDTPAGEYKGTTTFIISLRNV